MVVAYNFQDIFDASSRASTISLPTFKQNSMKLVFENSNENETRGTVYGGQEPTLPFAQSEVFLAAIADWRRLTVVNDDCKAIYEITFDITGSSFNFRPGDTIGIISHNTPADVDSVFSHLNLTALADLPYHLTVDSNQKAKVPAHVPVKSTLRHVITHCVDLRSVLKKLFILALSRHTKDENERKVLEYLCSKEGSATYTTHVVNKNLCLLDLFMIFKSCKPPIEVILSNLPRLLPRPYSIANSGLRDPNVLKICFSVMEIGNHRKGLTSGWLEEIILNNQPALEDRLRSLSINNTSNLCVKVPMYIRNNVSGFTMPEDLETPLLLIGPGTGVAPYIGFLEELEVIRKVNPEARFGNVWLFFGCRNPKLDYIYEEELNNFVQNGTLNKLSTTFSRVDQSDSNYVQDALIQNGDYIVKLILNGASVFVCGDLKAMAQQVKETLETCLVKYGDMSPADAAKFICDMQKRKKYLTDIWS